MMGVLDEDDSRSVGAKVLDFQPTADATEKPSLIGGLTISARTLRKGHTTQQRRDLSPPASSMLHVTLGWTWLSPSRMWLSRSEGRKPVEQNILDKYVSDLTRKIQSYSSAIDNLQAFIDFVQDKPVRNISEKMERWRQGRFQYHPSWPELKGRNCKDVVNLWIQWKSSTKGWSQHKAEGAARTLGLNFAWLNGQLDQIALYKGQVSRLKTLVQAAMRVSIPRYIPPLSELAKAAFDKSQDAMVQDVERCS